MPELSTMAREVSNDEDGIAYSFCTLVNDLAEYEIMVRAFAAKGFTTIDCEFIYIDNATVDRFDAFDGYNRMLSRATGRHIVLCHQDILPIDDDRSKLDGLLDQLHRTDRHWGLCGNAGANDEDDLVIRISDAWGSDRNAGGPFPARVMSYDHEVCIIPSPVAGPTSVGDAAPADATALVRISALAQVAARRSRYVRGLNARQPRSGCAGAVGWWDDVGCGGPQPT